MLVVDDEQAIRDLLRLALERAGHTVLDVCNGEHGFRLVVRVLDLLCKIVEATKDPGEWHINFIDLHLDALHAINAGYAGDEKSSIAQMLLMDLESAASRIAHHCGDRRCDPVS